AGLVRAPGFTDRRSPGREASARPRAARTVDAGLPAEGRGSDAAAPGTGSATGRDERVAAPFARAAGAETVAAGAETVAAGAETVAAGPGGVFAGVETVTGGAGAGGALGAAACESATADVGTAGEDGMASPPPASGAVPATIPATAGAAEPGPDCPPGVGAVAEGPPATDVREVGVVAAVTLVPASG